MRPRDRTVQKGEHSASSPQRRPGPGRAAWTWADGGGQGPPTAEARARMGREGGRGRGRPGAARRGGQGLNIPTSACYIDSYAIYAFYARKIV